MDTLLAFGLAAFGLTCTFQAGALQRWIVQTTKIQALSGPTFLWWNRIGGALVFLAAIYGLAVHTPALGS